MSGGRLASYLLMYPDDGKYRVDKPELLLLQHTVYLERDFQDSFRNDCLLGCFSGRAGKI